LTYKTTEVPFHPEIDMPPRLLLGPGPSMVHPRVLSVMARPLVSHLDPRFLELMNRTQELLRYTFETQNQLTIPISGTGSAAMETAVANMIEPGDPALVCVNGYFGERLVNMVGRYGGDLEVIHRPWGQVFTPQEVRLALDNRPAKVVAIVHAETSSGALQPLEEIAGIVHTQGGILIADAVTSLGGISLGVDKMDIDVCYSCSQKCLSCPPGISPITLGPRAVERLEKRVSSVPNWYLDLTMVQKYWGKERTYHHTAPITSVYALYEGLRLVAEEGLEARCERHHRNAEYLWQGLEELGMSLAVPRQHRLTTLTTVRVPEGFKDAEVRSRLLKEYNIEIGGGLGELAGQVWRIGLMGFSSRRENVTQLLGALRNLLKS
jgi:alanine-glyoxylate transaminase / serine-glyoxylate transaminase / serine-pyruvate transaminase